jgi:hypothetical protein
MVYFQTKNPNLGKFCVGLGLEKVGKFYSHLDNMIAILYFLCPLSNLAANWYISPRFGILCQKIWQPCSRAEEWGVARRNGAGQAFRV